jgi:hypothetical protein
LSFSSFANNWVWALIALGLRCNLPFDRATVLVDACGDGSCTFFSLSSAIFTVMPIFTVRDGFLASANFSINYNFLDALDFVAVFALALSLIFTFFADTADDDDAAFEPADDDAAFEPVDDDAAFEPVEDDALNNLQK